MSDVGTGARSNRVARGTLCETALRSAVVKRQVTDDGSHKRTFARKTAPLSFYSLLQYERDFWQFIRRGKPSCSTHLASAAH